MVGSWYCIWWGACVDCIGGLVGGASTGGGHYSYVSIKLYFFNSCGLRFYDRGR